MDLKFLQANINHSARAQDLLFQSMAEWSVHVAIIAEPYYVPPRNDWAGDYEGMVAIATRTVAGSSALEQVVRGRGYVFARVGGVAVIGVYFSPNRTLAEFESFLVELGAVVSRNRLNRVVVAGDFNAKSTAWGSPASDARGEELEEWAISVGLILINRGSVNTCVRQQGGSIVDLTFVDAALERSVRGWKVLVDEETLSDHRYIRFEVFSSTPSAGGLDRVPRAINPRWSLKRLNKEILQEAALIRAWVTASDDTCYRCGQVGHKAKGCVATPHCVVCAAAGRPAAHQGGSKACKQPKKTNRRGKTDDGPRVSSQSAGSSMGTEDVPMTEG